MRLGEKGTTGGIDVTRGQGRFPDSGAVIDRRECPPDGQNSMCKGPVAGENGTFAIVPLT